MTRLERVQSEDAREWKGFRRPARERLAWACSYLVKHGELNRRHIAEFWEVSEPQAANDLREIQARAPWLMQYDTVARTYRPKVQS